ncbi:DUF4249 domain-containing protein [Marinilabiliaceae bacterium JC017]|nr:DUF4249 domain-containing protein [Marinilabiliaceae bacterium JC017]
MGNVSKILTQKKDHLMSKNNLMKIPFSYMTIVLIFLACQPELDIDPEAYQQKIVVDGWIENDLNAHVNLTYSSPYTGATDSAALRKLVISTAKVTLFDGTNTEVLILRRDETLFPPVFYQSHTIKGEIGKTYELTVYLHGDTITASTTIPEPPEMTKLWLEPDAEADTMGVLKVDFTDPIETVDFYRFETKERSSEEGFRPVWLPNYSDKTFNGEQVLLTLYKGKDNPLASKQEFLFHLNKPLTVKVSRIDEGAFEFWDSYEDEVLNGKNPFASSNRSVKHNVEGALGIWCGYGAYYYLVTY